MSSGFVSGGTIDNEIERDDAWRAAQQEIEQKRRLKAEEEAKHGPSGQSLYEVLQANKAAKQEAFEEANRLKNQYRGLDDAEAEYLESLEKKKRNEEAAVRKDTLEQLEVFRRQQEEAERKALEVDNNGPPLAEDAQWIAGGRKRKKGHEGGLLKGVKIKKTIPETEETADSRIIESPQVNERVEADTMDKPTESHPSATTGTEIPSAVAKTTSSSHANTIVPPKSLALNLGYASSDEDE